MSYVDIALWLGGVYAFFCLFFFFGQDYFFFRPERLPTWFAYKYPFPFEELNLEMEDGGSVNCLHFRVPNARGVVFYIKGNSRSIKGWGKFARELSARVTIFSSWIIAVSEKAEAVGQRLFYMTIYNKFIDIYKKHTTNEQKSCFMGVRSARVWRPASRRGMSQKC